MNTDDLLSSPRAKQSLLKKPGKQTADKLKALRKAPSKTIANSSQLEVRALTDMKAFAELIKFQGGWENFGQCHEELVTFITKPQADKECQDKLAFLGDEQAAHLRRLVLMPRGHLKSTVGTVLYSLWRIYRNPEVRIMVGCNLQSLAYSFIREMRSHLENPELQDIWNNRPHIAGKLIPAIQKKTNARNFNNDQETEAEDRKVIWNNVALQVVRKGKYKEPTVFATSVGTTVTGMHFDLIILDDLVDFKNVESEVKKHQVEEWIADVESVLNPARVVTVESTKAAKELVINDIIGGEIVVNGTRYAVDDYYSQLIENADALGVCTHIRNIYKNGTDKSEGYLWHERYNDRIISALQARLSPRRFSSQYLNKVYEKDTNLFDTRAIQIISDSDVFTSPGRELCVRLPNGRIEVISPIICIDPAFSTSKTGDDCAILVGGKFSDHSIIVLDASLDRMTAAEVVKKVQEFGQNYNTLRVFSEANGVGMLVPELFKPTSSFVDGKPLLVNSHYEQRTKESKIQGVLELPINAGKVYFCQRVRLNETIWKQVGRYPGVRKDDFLDGLVTLYEKSLPSRKTYQSGLKNVTFDGVPLHIDHPEVYETEREQKGYIGQYNVLQTKSSR